MKRVTKTSLAISAAVLLAAGIGFAAEEHATAMAPETRAEAQMRAGGLFDKLDLNHDGKLDDADRMVRVNARFDQIDTNHDGSISRAEFDKAHDDMMGPGHHGMDHHGMDHPGMAETHPGDHHGRMGHWGEDHRQIHGLVMLILQRADPGHTGVVSRDAFVKGALSLFDQADTNHDGVLTPAEHEAFAQAMRQQMHEHWHQHGGRDGGMAPPSPPPAH